MHLRNTIFLLTMFLSLSSAKAMEKEWELIDGDLQPVTVYMWKSKDQKDEHLSVQTSNHYMSLRPVSEEIEESPYVNYKNPCFASPSPTIDQLLQDMKLNKGMKIGLNGESRTWPCETITLHLDTKSMDKLWEEYLEGAYTSDMGGFGVRILNNVYYVNERMREMFQRDIGNQSEPSRPDMTLYFTHATMALGLLGEGKLLDQNVYFLDKSKYFGIELWYPPLPYRRTAFSAPKKTNFHTRAWDVSVEDIDEDLQEALKRQELIKIHRNIENKSYGLDTLPTIHQQKVIEILNKDGTIESKREKIHTYLENLGKTYQAQRRYFSLAGWADTLWYREWTK